MEDARKKGKKKNKERSNGKEEIKKKGKRLENTQKTQRQLRAEAPLQKEG